jgi:hypothetical protein
MLTAEQAARCDALAIGDAALADAILQADLAQQPLPALPSGVIVPTLVKLKQPQVY